MQVYLLVSKHNAKRKKKETLTPVKSNAKLQSYTSLMPIEISFYINSCLLSRPPWTIYINKTENNING